MNSAHSQHRQANGSDSSGQQMQLLSPRLLWALEVAAYIHRNQCRKATKVPYISHLAGVMHLCAAQGGSEDLLIAALLHDSLEDVPEEMSYEQLEENFGKKVAQLVSLVTKDEKLDSWQQRAEDYLQRIANAPEELAAELNILVGADKFYNLQSIASHPESTTSEFWKRFRSSPQQNLWWYSSVYEQSHQYWSAQLQKEYRQALARLEYCVAQVTGDQ